MNILALLFPGFTAIDYIGPAKCWALTPGVKLQTAAYSAGPVRTDAGIELVATHSFETCWQEPDVLVIPGGGKPVFEALQDDSFLDTVARRGLVGAGYRQPGGADDGICARTALPIGTSRVGSSPGAGGCAQDPCG